MHFFATRATLRRDVLAFRDVVGVSAVVASATSLAEVNVVVVASPPGGGWPGRCVVTLTDRTSCQRGSFAFATLAPRVTGRAVAMIRTRVLAARGR